MRARLFGLINERGPRLHDYRGSVNCGFTCATFGGYWLITRGSLINVINPNACRCMIIFICFIFISFREPWTESLLALLLK